MYSKKSNTYLLFPLLILAMLLFNSCKEANKKEQSNTSDGKVSVNGYPNDVIPFFEHWNLILGDGSNVGQATKYENKDFFYTAKEKDQKWVVFKTPNAGNTHGTSNNTRTELAQLKEWSPMTDANLKATLKVMNVATTGDARVAATFSAVVGQIHSADGHENEPFKLFYKKFPGHTKGSVFWNYEINTAGDDNSGRWDFSYPIWGYDFSVVGPDKNSYCLLYTSDAADE